MVFDGYQKRPSTKDVTHLNRTGAHKGVLGNFTGDMVMKSKKDEFLVNQENKQKFIKLLGEKLEQAGCVIIHAEQDADFLIAMTALTSAKEKDTVRVGDHTNLLILWIYHADLQDHNVFFAPEIKATSKKH